MKHKSIMMMIILIIPLLIIPQAIVAQEMTITPVRSVSPNESGLSKLMGSLRDIITSNTGDVDVIFEMNGNYESVISDISASGGRVTQQLSNSEILAATIPANSLLKLSLNDRITRIFKDETVQVPDDVGMKGEKLLNQIDEEAVAFETITDLNPNMDANAFLTDAPSVWMDTMAGQGQVIAIIDTGVLPHVTLGSRLIGGVDLTIDVGSPYEGYDNPNNIYHGTFVASQAAGNALVTFGPGSAAGAAFAAHNPYATTYADGSVEVPLLGTAPLASIYAIKVFSAWGYTTTSTILAGIDHAITIGADVINLSLGGASNTPGENLLDIMVDAASDAGIAVVISAGNEGPNPLNIGSPGTAMSAITVGAASTPMQERIVADYYLGSGYGDYYYSHDEKSIVYFSSRGPTSDGRMKPDLVATGSNNFGAFGYYSLGFGSGTSFSAPVVAGGAALLSAYSDMNDLDLSSADIKKALVAGAVPIPGFTDFEQGSGYMNLANSVAYLADMDDNHDSGHDNHDRDHDNHDRDHDDMEFSRGEIKDNVEDLLPITKLDDGVATFTDLVIAPATFAYFTFEVSADVDFVKVSMDGVWSDDDNPIFGDRAWGYMSTTMANGAGNYYDLTMMTSGDYDMWTYSDFGFQAGLIRVTIENDFISFGNLHIDSLSIEVVEASLEAEHGGLEIENEGAATLAYVDVYEGDLSEVSGYIMDGGIDMFSFSIPDAWGFAILELSWDRDYSMYGTDDLDFYVFDSWGYFVAAGAGWSVPEVDFVLFADTYEVWVVGYDVYDPAGTDYTMKIIYFTDLFASPVYSSSLMLLPQDSELEMMLPAGVHGVAVLGSLQPVSFWGMSFYLDVWNDFAQV